MSLRRGGTPLTGALPSLEASNQAQINDLVQRNRTLEHTNKKLVDQVALEQNRTKDAVLEIQRKWEANELQWKEGCEDILRSYRIVQKQLEIEVEMERGAVTKEMAITREEKLQRLKRDYKIKLFQMKEEELERTIEDLEEEKAVIVETAELELQGEREKCAQYAAKLKETRESYQTRLEDARSGLKSATKEKEDKEAEYNDLRKEHSILESKIQTMDTKFQRTRLQLEGAQTKITELERLNNDLKRTNANLTNQIERWQNLETKGGEAAEQHQKRNLELESQLQELESQLQELQEAHDEEKDKASKELAKEKKRLDNLKGSMTNWELEAKNKEKANVELEKQLAKLQKLNGKLKADLEEERARVRPLSPQKSRVQTPPPPDEENDEDDEIPEEPVPPKKPSSKKAPVPKPSSSTRKEDPNPPSKPELFRQIARKSTGGKPPPPRPKKDSTPEIVEISDLEVEEEPVPTKKKRAKSKAVEPDHSEEEEAQPTQKQKGKRKAVDEGDEDVESVDKTKTTKKGPRAASELKETAASGKTKAKRTGSKQPSTRPGLNDEDDEDQLEAQVANKRKKRKIIPSVAPGPFAFDSLKFDNGGLNIPSILSPLKQDEHVPQRSTSSNLVGNSKRRQ